MALATGRSGIRLGNACDFATFLARDAARFRGRAEVNEMQIEPFELERWQSLWENKVELNISESGVHPLTTAELVPDVEQLKKILDVQQLYPQTNGSEDLRSENKVELNISESGVHPLTTAELVPDVEQLKKILDVQQLYPQTNGSEELRTRIAELYPGAQMGNVLGRS